MPRLTKESRSSVRLQFFELIFEDSEGMLCLAVTSPHAPKVTFRQTFWEWPERAIDMENYILKHESEFNCYFCVNLLSRNERKKEACLPTSLLWADLDEVEPMSLRIPPPIAIQSSPGRYQALWRLTTELPAYQAEDYSRRLAYTIDADKSGWDLTQLLRIPFTKNFKYEGNPEVALLPYSEKKAPPLFFEALAAPTEKPPQELPEDLPSAEEIIRKYAMKLKGDSAFTSVFSQEPAVGEDWSKILWRLIHILFEVGMEATEVFVIANASPCNKYARDNRPAEHLWRDILKAQEKLETFGIVLGDFNPIVMPELVKDKPEGHTFIEQYRSWAEEATDAVPEFHDLAATIMLSAIVSNSVRLDTRSGQVVPNLWGLMLGESTVTRKTTSMRMMIDILNMVDPTLIVATDGSPEGLLTGLETRPNKTSIFYRDEVSGFFDSINRKDYLSSMPEILTALYDVPPIFTRLLRKSIIRIESPSFIFFGGGIPSRVYDNVTDDYIISGFLPRFLVVNGEADIDRIQPMGPPTDIGTGKRAAIIAEVMDLYENYAVEAATLIGGQTVLMPPRVRAELTQKAWTEYNRIENILMLEGINSPLHDLTTPMFERMGRSILKMGITIGASRQKPKPGKPITISDTDIKTAAWYIQSWGQHSIKLILNAGKKSTEKQLDKALQVIRENPGILRSILGQHYHLSKKELDEILTTLEDRGLIYKERQGRGWRLYPT